MSHLNLIRYERPSPKAVENEHQIGKQGGDPDERIAENHVRRVARNISRALANPDTPPLVKQQVTEYFMSFAGTDRLLSKHAIEHVFYGVLLEISRPPFVPDHEYIEALTADNSTAALAVAQEYDREQRSPKGRKGLLRRW